MEALWNYNLLANLEQAFIIFYSNKYKKSGADYKREAIIFVIAIRAVTGPYIPCR